MQVGGHQFSDAVIKLIEQTIASDPQMSRRQLSGQVCQWLHRRSVNGKLKEMGCRTALLKLHRRGKLQLPPPRVPAAVFTAKDGANDVQLEECAALDCSLSQLGPVELVAVGSRCSRASKIWRALMQCYHPLGAGPLCGAQLRYLIRSPRHGWLGGWPSVRRPGGWGPATAGLAGAMRGGARI